MAKTKRTTEQTVIYKSLHRKEKIKQHHITPRYSWNIANVGAKHHPINQSILIIIICLSINWLYRTIHIILSLPAASILSFFHLRLLIFLWYLQTLHSWLITGCVIRAKRRVPLVEQELLTHSVQTRYLVGFALLDRFLIFCVVFWKIIVCPFVLFFFWPL
jgi:hypothetical protein